MDYHSPKIIRDIPLIKKEIKEGQVKVKKFFKRRFSRFRRLVPRYVHGNEAKLLTGNVAFPEMISAMKKAKKSINIEMYIFRDDKTGSLVAKTLKERAKKGVNVNVLYDAFGAIYTSNEFFEDLRRAGINVAEHNSVNPIKSLRSAIFNINIRDHRKIVIIDGKIAFIGGMNFSNDYYKNWNDVMVKIEGPVVQDLQITFFKQWQDFVLKPIGNKKIHSIAEIGLLDKRYRNLYFPEHKSRGDKFIGIIAGSPLKAKKAIHELYSDAIESANKSIIIETPYFVPTQKLMKKMLKKLKEGVSLKIIIPEAKSSDIPSLNLVSYYYLEPLLKAGAKVYLCSYKEKVLHAKICIVDNYVTIVGSSNVDSRSFKYSYEINAAIFNKKFAEETYNKIKADLSESKLFDEKIISKLSAKEKVISKFYWLIKGLL